jgi:hypothetical protein
MYENPQKGEEVQFSINNRATFGTGVFTVVIGSPPGAFYPYVASAAV